MSSCKAAPACRTKKNRNPDETPRVDLRHRRRHAYVIGIRQHGRIRRESDAECLHIRCARAPRAPVFRVARHAQRYDAARQFLHHRRDAPSMAVSADLARYPSRRQRRNSLGVPRRRAVGRIAFRRGPVLLDASNETPRRSGRPSIDAQAGARQAQAGNQLCAACRDHATRLCAGKKYGAGKRHSNRRCGDRDSLSPMIYRTLRQWAKLSGEHRSSCWK